MTREKEEVEVEVHEGRKPVGSMFSFRLKPGELQALKDYAETRGMSTGEFVRKAALEAMRRGTDPGAFDETSRPTGPYLVVPLDDDVLLDVLAKRRAAGE